MATAEKGALTQAIRGYRYRSSAENQLAPIAIAAAWPWLAEQYGLGWGIGIIPRVLRALVWQRVKQLRFVLQRVALRFEKLAAYSEFFPRGATPDFAETPQTATPEIAETPRGATDAAFAFYRIAGPNPLMLQQELDLEKLCQRIPLDRARIEARFRARGGLDLAQEAARGRLFAVDHRLNARALAHDLPHERGPQPARDSRWRNKYLAAPIAVFLEAPGFHGGCDLAPLAIRIDQPEAPGHNPVYYPDDGSAWRIAKAHFEVADSNFQVIAGHTGRTHMVLSAFCMASGRRLSASHPVSVLLRPHLRYTLASASAAYGDYVERANEFHSVYAGTLEASRNIAKLDSIARRFSEFAPLRDFARRGVMTAPADYPYRDDALLWVSAIERFVGDYVAASFARDEDVLRDAELQAWADELMNPRLGNVAGLFEGDRLATRAQLAALLAQLVFTAGPYHASQHFAGNYYYRFAPVFPSAATRPPPLAGETPSPAALIELLPPVAAALKQFTVNSLSNYQYDRFGDYRRFALSRAAAAQPALQQLARALAEIERVIAERAAKRMFRSDFMKPSLVPNSANI